MRDGVIFILTLIHISALGQNHLGGQPSDLSPDGKFELLVTKKELTSDLNKEWKYWLVSKHLTYNDTLLLTTAITHDGPPPQTFWDKSSKQLIYEDQSTRENVIKIYQLVDKKVIFETKGLIWGDKKKHYDQERGIILFFKYADRTTFDLMTLDIETKQIKKIKSIATSSSRKSELFRMILRGEQVFTILPNTCPKDQEAV